MISIRLAVLVSALGVASCVAIPAEAPLGYAEVPPAATYGGGYTYVYPAPPAYYAPPPAYYASPRFGRSARPFDHDGDRWRARRDDRYGHNGRCDDPRYETSNGGQARPGSDEADCRRYGGGLKGRYR